MSENKTASCRRDPRFATLTANGKAKGMYEIGKVYEIDPAEVIQRDNRFSSVITNYDFAVLKNDIIKHGQLQPCIGYETFQCKSATGDGQLFWACENLKNQAEIRVHQSRSCVRSAIAGTSRPGDRHFRPNMKANKRKFQKKDDHARDTHKVLEKRLRKSSTCKKAGGAAIPQLVAAVGAQLAKGRRFRLRRRLRCSKANQNER